MAIIFADGKTLNQRALVALSKRDLEWILMYSTRGLELDISANMFGLTSSKNIKYQDIIKSQGFVFR